jgi:SAM-dependent methyltransferase
MAVEYAQRYYDSLTGAARQSTREIVPILLEFISPQSVVDVGCGAGGWLAEFQQRGVTDVWGIDGPWVSKSQLQLPVERFEVADIGQPIRHQRRYDLAICLEAAEHLPPSAADTLVESLTGLSDVILFSAAIPFQGGEHHVNEQWPDYWVEKFENRHYVAIDCLRPRIWSNPKVEYWYAQNMFLLVAESRLQLDAGLRAAAARTNRQQLSLVHPRTFLEGSVRAKRPAELIQVTLGAIRRALSSRA